MTKCIGCGYKLQNKDEKALGYTPKEIDSSSYCQRCFRIINYGDVRIIDKPHEENQIINEVNAKGKLVFFLVDFLNINNETMDMFQRIKIDKILVISKSDIIPSSVRTIRVASWIKDEYAINNDILFISSLRNNNVSSIISIMEKYLVKAAYMLGYTNSGKSSLINKLYEKNQNKKASITTSVIPNTTMDFIRLKITEDITLIDSPGFVLKNNIYDSIDIELIKRVNAKTFLKPITYQMKKDESIILEDKFRFQYLDENKSSFTFYVSGKIDLDKYFINNNKLIDLEQKEYEVNDNSDVVIKGVGFFNIKKGCNIRIYSKYLDLIEIRKSVF